MEPPPATVTVATPVVGQVTDYLEVTGTVEAIETVEIRARVEGFLLQAPFTDGEIVEKGQLLYQIDPAEYQARVEQAEASLATALASRKLAEATLARRKRAFETGAVSELEVLENQAQRDVAVARVQSAEAELRNARLDLSYTTILSPTRGRVGRTLVDPGNLVGAGEKTLLTSVVRYDPIYAYMSINERALLRLVAGNEAIDESGERIELVGEVPVEVGRATDKGYPIVGLLDFADQGIDPETGTLLTRAVFHNAEPVQLIPGLFVRGRIPLRQRQGVLMVSERSLGQDQAGRYVLVVDENDVVQYRAVEVGALVDGMRVIEKGLEASDRVITNGVLFARPGARVKPELETLAASGGPSPPPEAEPSEPEPSAS